ncbi:hypothetical protein CDL12_18446 [Handroanthus impetiginosus]|uniref:Bifunctional inhibitor/plant lipid transfer protein/seed storage helical domain-containing protein n=1 Tax=Handroanthus impetiginosus TaxID=429701 RepID=A0A2G9GVD0_9LAMI|nr:hypothetical protein CDL12_18446 [Handroanthus impetiginosus]
MADFLRVLFLMSLLVIAALQCANGAGVCGRSSPDKEAVHLAPCAAAAKDKRAPVPASCCSQIKRIGHNPACLCAVLFSRTAKASGAKPQVAITIPKRCGFAHRPVGYKCGPYTLP